jgi:protein-L-isoaspartate(D-aspartate) O-methyltransferase
VTLEECRRFYSEEIRVIANLDSPALVEAFARVPREKFLGPGPWQLFCPNLLLGKTAYRPVDDPRDLYHNVLIAIDASRGLNNGLPSALAQWIKVLDLKSSERILHVGCGVGYYTAIMAEVVGSDGNIVASEVDPDLAARATVNLCGYRNVTVHAADGAALDAGTFDAMFINAGVTHPHRAWLECLNEGGRMVVPITFAGEMGTGIGVMLKITNCKGKFTIQVVSEVGIYHCTSVRDANLEPVIRKALATKALLNAKVVRTDLHEQADTCILHRNDVCVSSV